MAPAGSFWAVLLFLCACLPIHLAASSTMWSIDDILKPPQTWAPNILPTPPPSPGAPQAPATFMYWTPRLSPSDTLKQTKCPLKSPPANFCTPPPSPRGLPAPYTYQTLPGSTPKRPHPYRKAIVNPLHQPSRFLPLANLDSSANSAMASRQNHLPLTPIHPGQWTTNFLPPNTRFASPAPVSDQYQCKPFVPPPNARFANSVPPATLDQLCKPFIPVQTKSNNNWAKGVFESWITSRNAFTEEKYPVDLLKAQYPFYVIDRTLAAFVIEARRVDGNHYPGTTLKKI